MLRLPLYKLLILCRFYEAARIFNTYIGLELQPGTSASVTASHDYKALWLWVKAHRAEVASLAEAQLGGHVAEFPFSLQTPNLEVPKTGNTKSSDINEPKLLLDSPPSPLTPTPLKSSKHDGLSQDPIFQSQFPTQPTQMRDPHVADPSIQERRTVNTISQTSFETTPTLLPTPHIASSSPGVAQSPSLGSLCEFKLHPFTQLFV